MMDKDILIEVNNLSKKFCKDLKTSLWYGLKDLFSNATGNNLSTTLRDEEFWAVRDINFKLQRGECLGVIGHNGAGKSTLLKIINGLINPDEGKVVIKGRIGALIELGAGFNPILTGRENIYNNGAILGFTKTEINLKLNEIIEFAELEEFIDMPVQNYSSGMKVRLGFAVAAQMEPDVMLIDEVLAVGDLGFIMKCFKIMGKILPNTAIVFVSHSMPMISRVCNKILLLNHGQETYFGTDVAKGIDLYYSYFSDKTSNVVFSDNTVELIDVKLITETHSTTHDMARIEWGDDLKLHFRFKLFTDESILYHFRILILDKELREVGVFEENENHLKYNIVNNEFSFILEHKSLELSKGVYSIDLLVAKDRIRVPVLRHNNIFQFQVLHAVETWPPFLLNSRFISN